MTNREQFLKKHKLPKDTSLSLMEISKLSGFPLTALRLVYNKGIGAAKTTGITRPEVTSPEQWAMGRVYAFVMKTKPVFYGSDRHIAVMYNLI
jgi:hypothetical protein